MTAFLRENATALVLASGTILLGIVLGLVVAAAIRPDAGETATTSPSPVAALTAAPSASAPATPSPPSPTPAPSATPSSTPLPSPSPTSTGPTPAAPAIDIPSPIPSVDIDGADPESVAAIEEAIAAVDALDAYRTETELIGRDILDVTRDNNVDLGMRATVDRDPVEAFDALIGFRMVEFDNSAAISSGYRVVRIGDEAWAVEQDKVESVEPDGTTVVTVPLLLPGGTASRLILPFAGGYERIGTEQHDGLASTHYALTDAGKAAYADVTGLRGDWAGDLWVAADGGYLVEGLVTATRPDPDAEGRDISYSVVVTDANAPDIEVKPPA